MSRSPQTAVDGTLTVHSVLYGRDVAVVTFDGELDLANVDTAARALREALGNEEKLVVLDLQELRFIDSSGIALLAGLNGDGARIRVVPSKSLGVSRILAATGMDGMLKIVKDGTGSHGDGWVAA